MQHTILFCTLHTFALQWRSLSPLTHSWTHRALHIAAACLLTVTSWVGSMALLRPSRTMATSPLNLSISGLPPLAGAGLMWATGDIRRPLATRWQLCLHRHFSNVAGRQKGSRTLARRGRNTSHIPRAQHIASTFHLTHTAHGAAR